MLQEHLWFVHNPQYQHSLQHSWQRQNKIQSWKLELEHSQLEDKVLGFYSEGDELLEQSLWECGNSSLEQDGHRIPLTKHCLLQYRHLYLS